MRPDKKRAVPWILGLLLALVLGTSAYAQDAVASPAMSLGSGNLEKGNKVHLGARFVNNTVAPISWLVLGPANSTDLKAGDTDFDAENARLLLAEQTQGDIPFIEKDSEREVENLWQGSYAQKWCSDFFLNGADGQLEHFSTMEKAEILSTRKTDAAYGECGPSTLENEKVFLLSGEEASEGSGYFPGGEGLTAYQYDVTYKTQAWWLRSPLNGTNNAARVNEDGITGFPCRSDLGTRPACNLRVDHTLFTTAAGFVKSSDSLGLRQVPETSAKEWKLTLHDESRDVDDEFTAAPFRGSTLSNPQWYTDWKISYYFAGARAGENECVSAMLCDSEGRVLYYGQIARDTVNSPDGGAQVTIPEGLVKGHYQLHLFSEQLNGDKGSDFASSLHTTNLTVTEGVPPAPKTFNVTFTDGLGTILKTESVEEGKPATAPAEPAREGYAFAGWSSDFSSITQDLTVDAQWTANPVDPPEPEKPAIVKKANTLKVKGKTAKLKYAKVKKVTQKLGASKVLTFTNKGQGKLTYAKTSGSKKITISKTTGKVTVKKGLKKGTYKVQVKVKAAGDTTHKAITKTVTFKIKIK